MTGSIGDRVESKGMFFQKELLSRDLLGIFGFFKGSPRFGLDGHEQAGA